MAYKNIDQLKQEYPVDEFKLKFKKIFEINMLFNGGYQYDCFKPAKIFSDAIVLTPYGESVANFLKDIDDSLNDSDLKFLLFSMLYHEDLLIDIPKTKLVHRGLNKPIFKPQVPSLYMSI